MGSVSTSGVESFLIGQYKDRSRSETVDQSSRATSQALDTTLPSSVATSVAIEETPRYKLAPRVTFKDTSLYSVATNEKIYYSTEEHDAFNDTSQSSVAFDQTPHSSMAASVAFNGTPQSSVAFDQTQQYSAAVSVTFEATPQCSFNKGLSDQVQCGPEFIAACNASMNKIISAKEDMPRAFRSMICHNKRWVVLFEGTIGSIFSIVAKVARVAIKTVLIVPKAVRTSILGSRFHYKVEGATKEVFKRYADEWVDLGVAVLTVPFALSRMIVPTAFNDSIVKIEHYYAKRQMRRDEADKAWADAKTKFNLETERGKHR